MCAFLEGKLKMCTGVGVCYARALCPGDPCLKSDPLWSPLVSHALLEPHLDLILGVEGCSSSPEHYCDKYWYQLYGKIIFYAQDYLCIEASFLQSLITSEKS